MLNRQEITFFTDKLLSAYPPRKLKQCFSHNSFYQDNKDHGYRKYIFIAQTVFKGQLALYLIKHYPYKSVDELEQVVNKIYSTRELVRIYNIYSLSDLVRAKNDDDTARVQSRFALVFLGLMQEVLNCEELQNFIYLNFIKESDFLFNKNPESDSEPDITAFLFCFF